MSIDGELVVSPALPAASDAIPSIIPLEDGDD